MANGIKRAEVLDIEVAHAIFIHERGRRGFHQLVILRSQDGVRDALLGDRTVCQLGDSITVGQEVGAGSAANCLEDRIDERAGEVGRDVCDLVQV